jgi:protein SCO1/2
MKRNLTATLVCLATAIAAAAQTPTQAPRPPVDPHAGHQMPAQPAAQEPSPAQKYFSDVQLVDQDGRTLRFYSDMLKGKTVVINAFFTTCTSVCPPMSRNLELLQQALGDRVGRDVFIVSISVDPLTDTPPPKPAEVADPHAGHQMGQQQAQQQSPAQKWFSDVELLDQDGRKVHFYTDMLKGKTVVINAFFTTCTSVCPPMNRNLEKVQEALGDRLGKDVFIVSISVDPATDTPTRLKEYARRFHAKPGWTFLTGKKENVDWALYKLGQYVEDRNAHTTVIIVGNEATGLWKKMFGMGKTAELIQIVESVANDKGETNDDKGGSK